MLYMLSRLQLRAVIVATLYNRHILSAYCVQSPAQGTGEDSGILIFKDLQPNIPNWGAGQNHNGPTSELNQIGTKSVLYGKNSKMGFIYVLGCDTMGQCERQACVPLTKKEGQVQPLPQRGISKVL